MKHPIRTSMRALLPLALTGLALGAHAAGADLG